MQMIDELIGVALETFPLDWRNLSFTKFVNSISAEITFSLLRLTR